MIRKVFISCLLSFITIIAHAVDGLEDKAKQLEKELEQEPATDTVLAIQSETD